MPIDGGLGGLTWSSMDAATAALPPTLTCRHIRISGSPTADQVYAEGFRPTLWQATWTSSGLTKSIDPMVIPLALERRVEAPLPGSGNLNSGTSSRVASRLQKMPNLSFNWGLGIEIRGLGFGV